ncbi:MAG: hypothetical protein M3Y05_15435, partial [Gemmatimonadota bacterium]|nr:hypothetical protein [Gemmatimonadota bacterium]
LAKAQWLLGRPSLYAIPSAIPALHLGETIYHPAHEPRAITGVSSSLVRAALARADADLAVRRAHADELDQMAARSRRVQMIRAIPGSLPGFLRFPVRVADARMARPDLGIVRGYPETLAELAELQPSLMGGETLTGARELRRTLVTLPTHALLDDDDVRALTNWLG